MIGGFSRGNVNINSAESVYRLNPRNIFIGSIIAVLVDLILLSIIYFGLQSTLSTMLICLILIMISNACFVAITVYASRLYLREEMVDMASLFASYNPQILNGGGALIGHMGGMIKEGRNDAIPYAKLIQELEQLKRTYEMLIANSQDMNGNVAPLANSGNVNFTPFIDGD